MAKYLPDTGEPAPRGTLARPARLTDKSLCRARQGPLGIWRKSQTQRRTKVGKQQIQHSNAAPSRKPPGSSAARGLLPVEDL